MAMPMMPLHRADEDQGADYELLQEYEYFLVGKAEGTIEAYLRTVRHVMRWVAARPGNGGRFQPHQLTKTAVEMYLDLLEQDGFSINHRARVKSTISSFARWLIEEKGLLQRNPTRGVDIPPQQALAPRREFHRLLVPFCSSAELTELELQEQRVFSRLWNMWYFFAFHPQLIMPKAIEECTEKLEAKRQMVQRDVRKAFRRLAQEGLQVDILSRTVPWNREPALWITIDAKEPLDAYRSGERVIAVLRKAMHRVNEKLLRRYALGFLTTYALIVPVVQGKSLTAQAWRVFLPGLLVGDDESPPLLVPQSLPPDTLSSLGIEVWALPQVEAAKQGWERTVELSLLTARLRDIQRLPPFEDGQERELIRLYIDQIVARINTVLQEVLYTEKALIDRWNSRSPTELSQRPALAQAVHHLSELLSSVLPTADFQGEVEMRLERVAEWAQRLEKGRECAFLIYLLFATDTLGEKQAYISVK